MKKILYIFIWLLFAACFTSGCASSNISQENAQERVKAFANEIDYNYRTPENIYEYLTQEYKDKITKSKFVEAFSKERSYPYLTPFFINFESIEMSKDKLSGTAHFSQAARLPGMKYDIKFVYENGDYYMEAFEKLIDGSYLDKFKSIPYSLDSYFDFDK
jgi:hypothetical protein